MKAVPVCLCQCFNTLIHQLNLGRCVCSHSFTYREACWWFSCQLGLLCLLQLQLWRDACGFALSLVTGGTSILYIKTLFSLPRNMLFYKPQADMGTLLLRFPSQTALESFLLFPSQCWWYRQFVPESVVFPASISPEGSAVGELLCVTHAFVCKGPSTFIKPQDNEQ